LRSRGLLTSKPDLSVLGFNLEFIPDAERWDWVLKNVPECLDTKSGIQAMLNDSVCRTLIINYLDKLFSECPTELRRLELCEKISPVYSKLCECRDGEKLAKKIVHWFLKGPIFTTSTDAPLSTRYMDVLTKHIELVKTCFGNKEKKLFKKELYKTIEYLSQIETSDQFTSIFIELAENDSKLLKKLNIGPLSKTVLKHALNHAKSIESLYNRYCYVSALYKAASLYSEVDPKFVKDFYIEKEATVKAYKFYLSAKADT
jgi:hypothetical protein